MSDHFKDVDLDALGHGNNILMIDQDNKPQYIPENQFASAQKAGLKPASIYVDPSTHSKIYIPHGEESKAEDQGLVNAYHQQGIDQAAKVKNDFSGTLGQIGSAAVGAAKNATFGFAPSIVGATQAAKDLVLNGDTNVLDNYRTKRDLYKDVQNDAYDQNKKSYLAGAALPIVGGLAGGLLGSGAKAAAEVAPTLGAKVLQGVKTGAGFGALGGAGNSDSDLTKGDIKGFGKDVAGGAAIGGLAGGALEGAIGLGSAGKDAIKEYGKQILSGENHGSFLSNILNTGKNILSSAKDTHNIDSQLSKLAGDGESTLLQNIFSKGSNPTKDFLAQKAETVLPGNLSSAEEGSQSLLQKALNMSPEERLTARNFNKDNTAKSVVDNLTDTFKKIKEQKGNIFTQGQAEAEGAYDPKDISHALFKLSDGIEDAASGSLSSSVKSALNQANDTLLEGKALSSYGIQKGDLDPKNAIDVFRRLQAARESLDPALLQARQSGDSQASRLLGGVRNAIDEQLKSSAPKAAADKAYAEITQPLKSIMKPIINRDTQKIDPFKLGNTFNDSTLGKTFRANLDELSNAVSKYGDQMNPDALQSIKGTIKQLSDFGDISQNQKLLQSLRQANGPTSPALERVSSSYERAGLPVDLISKPASTLTQADNFLVTQAQKQFGKSFSDLEGKQQQALLDMLENNIQNPSATMNSQKKAFKDIADNLKENLVPTSEPEIEQGLTGENSPSKKANINYNRAKYSGTSEQTLGTLDETNALAQKRFGKNYDELSVNQKGSLKPNPYDAKDLGLDVRPSNPQGSSLDLSDYTPAADRTDPFLESKAKKIYGTSYELLSDKLKNALQTLKKFRGNDKGFIGDGGKGPEFDPRSKEEILKDLRNTFSNTQNSKITEELDAQNYPKSNRLDDLISNNSSSHGPSSAVTELDDQAQLKFGKNFKDLSPKQMDSIGSAGKYIANNKEVKDEITRNLMSDSYTPEVTLDHSPYKKPDMTSMDIIRDMIQRRMQR